MAKVPNGVETSPKISIPWVGCTNVTDRQTTDWRTMTYSEHELEFTFAKKEMCSSKVKPRLRAEWAVSSEQELILASCCLSPIRRNSVLDELWVKRLAVIHEEICCRAFWRCVMLDSRDLNQNLHKYFLFSGQELFYVFKVVFSEVG